MCWCRPGFSGAFSIFSARLAICAHLAVSMHAPRLSAQLGVRLGDYQLGLAIENDTMILVRILHCKDIYRKFP